MKKLFAVIIFAYAALLGTACISAKAESALDRFCRQAGVTKSEPCVEVARDCGKPTEYAMVAERTCMAADIVACWNRGLRPGAKLTACVDDQERHRTTKDLRKAMKRLDKEEEQGEAYRAPGCENTDEEQYGKCLHHKIFTFRTNPSNGEKPDKAGEVYVPGRCSAEFQKNMMAEGRAYRCKSYEPVE